MRINPKRVHPKRNFSFKIEGNPEELAGISAESNEGTVVNYVLLCAAERLWRENYGSQDKAEVVLDFQTAYEIARVVHCHLLEREKEEKIPVLGRTFTKAFIRGRKLFLPDEVAEAYNLTVSKAEGTEQRALVSEDPRREPIFGVDEPYTTLRRQESRREHTDFGRGSFRREQRY